VAVYIEFDNPVIPVSRPSNLMIFNKLFCKAERSIGPCPAIQSRIAIEIADNQSNIKKYVESHPI
jgi:hypothetical protein